MIFAKDFLNFLDFSDQSMLELYYSESYGDQISPNNGYYYGKKRLNLTVSMWKDDIIHGLLRTSELYNDPLFPHWWLDKVLKNEYIIR